MRVQLHLEDKKTGKPLVHEQKPLKELKAGQCFRFYENGHRSEDDVIRAGDIWMLMEAPETRDGRCRMVCLSNGKQLERDGDTWVIPHETTLQVSPSKLVPAPEPPALE